MGTYSSGLLALSPKALRTQVLTGENYRGVFHAGEYNGYSIYRISERKWYGKWTESLIGFIESLSDEDAIACVINEYGAIDLSKGELDKVNFTTHKTVNSSTAHYSIRSPITNSEPV